MICNANDGFARIGRNVAEDTGHRLNILLKFTLTVRPANGLGSGAIHLDDGGCNAVGTNFKLTPGFGDELVARKLAT